MVPKKDAKDHIYGTCHKCRGPSQSEYKEKATKWNGKQAGEVFGHVMRKEEMENLVTTGYPEGNLPDVPAKEERKDANRTDPPDKR